MKKNITVFLLLWAVGLYAGLVDDGFKAYEQGNYTKAVKLFRKACDSGVALGCYTLGLMYDAGQGVKQNYSTAAKFFRKACESGIAEACNNLGEMYYYKG